MKNMNQIVLCRDGKCVDLYFEGTTDIDIIECESLKEQIWRN